MEQHHQLNELIIDSVAANQLRETAKWSKFLAIISFIACALIVAAGFIMASTMNELNNQFGGAYNAGYTFGVAIFYTIMAIIWFIPSLFLFQSASKIKHGIELSDQQLLNEGLMKQKASFRFWGILSIIFICLFGLSLLVQLTKF